MVAFRYEALDSSGRTLRGVLEADTARQARSELRESGLTILEVSLIAQSNLSAGILRQLRLRRGQISTAQLSLITRQLATLLAAGLTLEQSLGALIEQSEDQTVRQVLAGVRAEVLAGNTLAQAMGSYETTFSDLYRSLIKAGESSGDLGEVMLRLADYTESRQALQQKVGLAFVYPAIVTVVALLVVGGLLVYVVPQVVGVFEQTHQTLPLLTRILIGLSDFLRQTWMWGLVLVVAGMIAAPIILRQSNVRFRVHSMLLTFPVVGRLIRGVNTARIASTLAILSGSGVPLLTGLQAATGVARNLPIRQALQNASAKVREGVPLNRALAASGLFPPILIHLIASGEASGQLDTMLERAAAQQEQEVASYTSVLTALLEPVLILFMGVVVLLIVLAILMPIIEMNQMVR